MSSSAGTYVAATFETAGQYFQSYVLDLLTTPLEGLVVLVFVIGCLSALTGIAFKGGLKGAVLLLLGPIIFLAVTMTRTDGSTVRWLGAKDEKAQKTIAEEAKEMSTEKTYFPRPSAVFEGYAYL